MKHDVTAPVFPRPQSVYSQGLKLQLISLNVPGLEILPYIKTFFAPLSAISLTIKVQIIHISLRILVVETFNFSPFVVFSF